MNLYRLDRADGSAVRDLLGPVLIRSAADARTRATADAVSSGQSVTVTRISGAGRLRAMYSIDPTGRYSRA